jgi:tRNA (Thr-GGU) A37 N-methylase
MKQICYRPIGYIRSEFTSLAQVPPTSRQNSSRGELHVYKKYAKGLQDIEGFSHLLIVWHMHKAPADYKLTVHPRPRPDLEVGGT